MIQGEELVNSRNWERPVRLVQVKKGKVVHISLERGSGPGHAGLEASGRGLS